jgi:chromosome segregation ATPase
MAQNEQPKKSPGTPGPTGDGGIPLGPPKSGDDPLIDAVLKAQESLKKAEAALASYQDGVKLKDTLSKIVEDYEAEYADLDFDQDELEDYCNNEVAELSAILSPLGLAKVEEVLKAAREEIQHLDKRIRDRTEDLAGLRARLEKERGQADAAKAEFEALKKPAASIKDRLKKAAAARIEVEKAHRAKNYAVAYWLLTSPTKFNGYLEGKPKLDQPHELAATVEKARKKYATAASEVDALDVRIKAGEKALKADLDLLADRRKSLEARIVQKLSEIDVSHPQHPQPVDSDAI